MAAPVTTNVWILCGLQLWSPQTPTYRKQPYLLRISKKMPVAGGEDLQRPWRLIFIEADPWRKEDEIYSFPSKQQHPSLEVMQ